MYFASECVQTLVHTLKEVDLPVSSFQVLCSNLLFEMRLVVPLSFANVAFVDKLQVVRKTSDA